MSDIDDVFKSIEVDATGLARAEVYQLANRIEEMFMRAWTNAVSGKSELPGGVGLHDHRYIEELGGRDVVSREVNPSGDMMTITFHGGPIAAMYEEGVMPYDMKPGLLGERAKNVKTGKSGVKYNTVPFRIAVDDDRKEKSAHFGQMMPKEIYAQAKKLKVSTKYDSWMHLGTRITDRERGRAEGTKWGGRLHTSDADLHKRGKYIFPHKSLGITPQDYGVRTYEWKTGKYEGMVKMLGTYAEKDDHVYKTFRRVSENSDPNSWWHPGFPKVGIIPALISYAESTILPIASDTTTDLNIPD